MASSVTLGIGVLLTVMAVLCFGLSFSTDYWAMWNVDRTALKTYATANPSSDIATNLNTQKLYFTRYYGLWRTCYPGNETYQFLSTAQGVTDNYCLLVNYELGEMAPNYSGTSEYWVMINLRRCSFGFMIAALVFGLLSCVAGTWGCWKATPSPNYIAGAMSLLGALFGGGSIGCFHGVHYLEQDVLSDAGFYSTWPTTLKNVSSWSLQWSYIVGWVGVALILLTSVLFLVEGYNIQQSENRQKKRKNSKRLHDYYSEMDRKGSISGHMSNPTVPSPVPSQPQQRQMDRQLSQKSHPPIGNGMNDLSSAAMW
ncbi:uncharacterized protein LOC135497653 isoform X2 [Lineus longissimus]|uniref:uncharacterized protein LOC135497653 isoform X2 n=1 Tax=Lineus longissimus TaxID=88925 RepID=UPI00315C88FC